MSFAWLGKKARVEDDPADEAGNVQTNTQQRVHQHQRVPNGEDVEPAREFSVHITHVPFTATKADLDEFFKEHDCVVDDIRMVRKVSEHR